MPAPVRLLDCTWVPIKGTLLRTLSSGQSLFYSDLDAYKNKGCCNDVLLGGSFASISQIDGPEYEIIRTLALAPLSDVRRRIDGRHARTDEAMMKVPTERWKCGLLAREYIHASERCGGRSELEWRPPLGGGHGQRWVRGLGFFSIGFVTLCSCSLWMSPTRCTITAFAADARQIGCGFQDWGSYYFYRARGSTPLLAFLTNPVICDLLIHSTTSKSFGVHLVRPFHERMLTSCSKYAPKVLEFFDDIQSLSCRPARNNNWLHALWLIIS